VTGFSSATISDATSPVDFAEARGLIEEYARSLHIDLCFQNFGDELENLARMYAPPDGALLLARSDGVAVGSVAIRPFEGRVCEMKRLYVRPAVRGTRLGKTLAERIIERARSAGYEKIVLDTLASMEPARALYRSLGFEERPPYYENPIADAVYMELGL
jgi:ribosomal protein S18 acetylase RimI-like enzyme